MPVEILGLLEVPQAGDPCPGLRGRKGGTGTRRFRVQRATGESLLAERSMKLTDSGIADQGGDHGELRVILKADVPGSLGAIQTALAEAE